MSKQASEDAELRKALRELNVYDNGSYSSMTDGDVDDVISFIKAHTNKAIKEVLDRLDKSMPTVEQLTTKYGYHLPEKMYGYKLALHDIREVMGKVMDEVMDKQEAEL